MEENQQQPQQQQQQQQQCSTNVQSSSQSVRYDAGDGQMTTGEVQGGVTIDHSHFDNYIHHETVIHNYPAPEPKPEPKPEPEPKSSFDEALEKTKNDDYHVFKNANGEDAEMTDDMVDKLKISHLLAKYDVTYDVINKDDAVFDDVDGKPPKEKVASPTSGRRGKRLALVGPSGSGKSVHASAITRYYKNEGHVALRISGERICGDDREIDISNFLFAYAGIDHAVEAKPDYYNKLNDLGEKLVIVVDGVHKCSLVDSFTSNKEDRCIVISSQKHKPHEWLQSIFSGEILKKATIIATMIPSVYTSVFRTFKSFEKLDFPCTLERRNSSLSLYSSDVSEKVTSYMDKEKSPVKCVCHNSFVATSLAKRVEKTPTFLEEKTQCQILVSILSGKMMKISPEWKEICYKQMENDDCWEDHDKKKEIEQYFIGEYCTKEDCFQVKPFYKTTKIMIAALHILHKISLDGKLTDEDEKKLFSSPKLLQFVCAWITSDCKEVQENKSMKNTKKKMLKIFATKLKEVTSQRKFDDHITSGNHFDEMELMLLGLYELHHKNHELPNKFQQIIKNTIDDDEMRTIFMKLQNHDDGYKIVENYFKFINPQLQRLTLYMTSHDMTSSSQLASIIAHQTEQQNLKIRQQVSGNIQIPLVEIYNIESFEQINPNIKDLLEYKNVNTDENITSLLNITCGKLHLNFNSSNFTDRQFKQIISKCETEFHQHPQKNILLQLSHNNFHQILLPRHSSPPPSGVNSPFNLVRKRKRSQTYEDATKNVSTRKDHAVILEELASSSVTSPTATLSPNKYDVIRRRKSKDDIDFSYAYRRQRSACVTKMESREYPSYSSGCQTAASRPTQARPPLFQPDDHHHQFRRSKSERKDRQHVYDVIINKCHQIDQLKVGGETRICEIYFHDDFTNVRDVIDKLSKSYKIHLLTLYNVREPLELIEAMRKSGNFLSKLHAWLVIRCLSIVDQQKKEICDVIRDVICEQTPSKKLRIDIYFDDKLQNIKPGRLMMS